MNYDYGAIDKPDKRDWKRSHLFWAIQEIPKRFNPPKIEIENQWLDRTPSTHMSCTRMSTGMLHRWQQKLEYKRIEDYKQAPYFDIVEFWNRAVKANPAIEVSGDYIINWVKQLKNEGYISWYYTVKTLDEMKEAISQHRFLATGSYYMGWEIIEWVRYFKPWKKKGGHAFHLNGYDDDLKVFYGVNSYWDNNGVFLVHYDDIWKLFTRYACIDIQDEATKHVDCKIWLIENWKEFNIIDKMRIRGYIKVFDIVEAYKLAKKILEKKKIWV